MATQNAAKIDIDNLHLELLKQCELFHDAAIELADAKFDVAEIKAKMEVCRADLANDIRTDPGAFAIVKITNDAIEAAVTLQKSYQEVLKKFNSCKRVQDYCQADVDMLDMRRRVLESLVQLAGQDYFSAPRVGGAARQVMEKEVKRSARAPLTARRGHNGE